MPSSFRLPPWSSPLAWLTHGTLSFKWHIHLSQTSLPLYASNSFQGWVIITIWSTEWVGRWSEVSFSIASIVPGFEGLDPKSDKNVLLMRPRTKRMENDFCTKDLNSIGDSFPRYKLGHSACWKTRPKKKLPPSVRPSLPIFRWTVNQDMKKCNRMNLSLYKMNFLSLLPMISRLKTNNISRKKEKK